MNSFYSFLMGMFVVWLIMLSVGGMMYIADEKQKVQVCLTKPIGEEITDKAGVEEQVCWEEYRSSE